MNWLKTSDVCKMLKAEIKAQTGKVVNVRKSQYGNIEVDISKYPHLKSRVEEIVRRWRSGEMGMFDNRDNFVMFSCVNPETNCNVVWNETSVHNNFLAEMGVKVCVSYDYISVVGGNFW